MTIWVDYAPRIQEVFEPRKSALLVVDVQHSFCAPEGRTGRKHSNISMQLLPSKINNFVKYFESIGGTTIYLKSVPDDTNSTENDRWLNKLKGHVRPSSPDSIELDLYGLDLKPDSLIIEKTGDGFSRSELKAILQKNKIENVLVCGVRTEICVRRVAERSSAEDYLVFVLSDLCATRDNCAEHEKQALLFLNAYTGVVLESTHMRKLLATKAVSADECA